MAAPVAPAELALILEKYPELSETFVAAEAEGLIGLGVALRIEARVRAPRPMAGAPAPPTAYAEDDTRATRVLALARLAAAHPVRCLADLAARQRWRREEDVPPLRVLAPVALRLRRAGVGHLHAHFAHRPALDALRLARVLGLPWSFIAHGFDIYQQPANLPEKLRAADFSASPCAYTQTGLRRLAPDAAPRMHVVVMGVDAERFRRTAPYPGGRAVLAVGRLVEKKGFAHLVEAVGRLERQGTPVDRLTIVGDGPLAAGLAARVERLGLTDRVELTGALPAERVRAALEAADVVVVPCVIAADGDRDSMPVIAKEALAMEVPVIASDAVGLPEVVRPPWGRLVPPGDVPALAEAIAGLLAETPEARAVRGAAGRAHVAEHADVRTEAERLLALVRQSARDAGGR
jgi:glycosyltransferase involved in cell wall biosynthesis